MAVQGDDEPAAGGVEIALMPSGGAVWLGLESDEAKASTLAF